MKTSLGLLLVIAFGVGGANACTSAVVSGKATRDGRPLLWKHRDSEFEHNKLRYFRGPSYDFIAVVNSDTLEDEAWVGSNSAGFSIMNTVAYNLNVGVKPTVPEDQEGIFMRDALGSCASVADFRKMLDSTRGTRGVAANFGVIDARGGAAFFEVGFATDLMYDANDTAVAPDGYIVRTNFALSGDKEHARGTIRCATACELFAEEFAKNRLSVEFILSADRNMRHALLRNDLLSGPLPADTTAPHFVPFRDYIVRNTTTSTMIVEGVKSGEDPRLTTLWTLLGFPLTTIVTPVWVAGGASLPRVTLSVDGKSSPINERALRLKHRCFPSAMDNGYDYLDLSAVANARGTGFIQVLLPKEGAIIAETRRVQEKMRRGGFDRSMVDTFTAWLDGYVTTVYSTLYGL